MAIADARGGDYVRSWLVDIRKAHNLSQAELARRVGIAQPSLWDIERGNNNPRPETAKRIAEILGFPWTRFYDN